MTKKQSKRDLDKVIGQNICQGREMRKLSRDELASMLDIKTSHMGLIERGHRGATATTLAKVSRIFDIPVDHLFGRPVKLRGRVMWEPDVAGTKSTSDQIQCLLKDLNVAQLNFISYVIDGITTMNDEG